MAICRGRTRPAPLPRSITPLETPEEIEARAELEAETISNLMDTGMDFYTAFRQMLAQQRAAVSR